TSLSRGRCLSIRRHEHIVDFDRLADQAEILLILHQRFQGLPVRLDAVGPRIAVEDVPDVVDLAHQEWRHVAHRAQIEQFLQRDMFRLDEGVVKARGDEGIALVDTLLDRDEMHDRVDFLAPVKFLVALDVIGEQPHDIGIVANLVRQAGAERRVDRAFGKKLPERLFVGVVLDRYFFQQRQYGRAAVRTRRIHRALHPGDFRQVHSELVLEDAVNEDRRSHRIKRHPDAFAGEVFRILYSRFAVDGDEAEPEGDRGKNRNGDERALAIDKALDELGRRIFGNVEFLAARHAIEDRPRLIDGDEIEIDAVGLHLAGMEREHPVIEPAGKRQLEPGHRSAALPWVDVWRTELAREVGGRKRLPKGVSGECATIRLRATSKSSAQILAQNLADIALRQ